MKLPRLLNFALPVVGAGLLAATAIAVTASAAGLSVGSLLAASKTPSPSASASTARGTDTGAGSAACQDFLGHLATQLGVSSDKLDTAAIAAGKQTIQDAVTAGKLTQAQADKIESKLSVDNLCRFGRGREAMAGAIKVYLDAAASALGISDTQLVADLKGGQTLSQVAAAQGVSEDTFKAKVVAAVKPQLDAAVASGKITADQEQKILDKLQNGDPPLWNGRPGKAGASPAPTPTT